MTTISERQRARFYIYKKKKTRKGLYIYTKARHFSKSKTICVTFLLSKIPTLYVMRFFMIFLKLAFIYIQKVSHFALRDVFINKKPENSKKATQFALRFFIYNNLDTLCYAIFH